MKKFFEKVQGQKNKPNFSRGSVFLDSPFLEPRSTYCGGEGEQDSVTETPLALVIIDSAPGGGMTMTCSLKLIDAIRSSNSKKMQNSSVILYFFYSQFDIVHCVLLILCCCVTNSGNPLTSSSIGLLTKNQAQYRVVVYSNSIIVSYIP